MKYFRQSDEAYDESVAEEYKHSADCTCEDCHTITFGNLPVGSKFYWQHDHQDVCRNHCALDIIKCKKLELHGGMEIRDRPGPFVLGRQLWTPLKGDAAGVVYSGEGYKNTPVIPA